MNIIDIEKLNDIVTDIIWQRIEETDIFNLNNESAMNILILSDSHSRFGWFLWLLNNGIFNKVSDEQKTFIEAYKTSDNIHLQIKKYLECEEVDDESPINYLKMYLKHLSSCGINNFMSSYERRYYKRLPEKITIYRGISVSEYESGNYGISWTLSKKKADFFSTYKRNGVEKGITVKKYVRKKDIIAYISSRNEKEILYIGK